MWKHAYPTEDEKVRHDVQESRQMDKMEAAEEDDANASKDSETSVHVERA